VHRKRKRSPRRGYSDGELLAGRGTLFRADEEIELFVRVENIVRINLMTWEEVILAREGPVRADEKRPPALREG